MLISVAYKQLKNNNSNEPRLPYGPELQYFKKINLLGLLTQINSELMQQMMIMRRNLRRYPVERFYSLAYLKDLRELIFVARQIISTRRGTELRLSQIKQYNIQQYQYKYDSLILFADFDAGELKTLLLQWLKDLGFTKKPEPVAKNLLKLQPSAEQALKRSPTHAAFENNNNNEVKLSPVASNSTNTGHYPAEKKKYKIGFKLEEKTQSKLATLKEDPMENVWDMINQVVASIKALKIPQAIRFIHAFNNQITTRKFKSTEEKVKAGIAFAVHQLAASPTPQRSSFFCYNNNKINPEPKESIQFTNYLKRIANITLENINDNDAILTFNL